MSRSVDGHGRRLQPLHASNVEGLGAALLHRRFSFNTFISQNAHFNPWCGFNIEIIGPRARNGSLVDNRARAINDEAIFRTTWILPSCMDDLELVSRLAPAARVARAAARVMSEPNHEAWVATSEDCSRSMHPM